MLLAISSIFQVSEVTCFESPENTLNNKRLKLSRACEQAWNIKMGQDLFTMICYETRAVVVHKNVIQAPA
jgi:hypothetical protein